MFIYIACDFLAGVRKNVLYALRLLKIYNMLRFCLILKGEFKIVSSKRVRVFRHKFSILVFSRLKNITKSINYHADLRTLLKNFLF